MLLVADQRSPEWKAAHLGRITSSVAPAALGIDPYHSRKWAWRMIVGLELDHDNPFIRWGLEQEPNARAAYETETGWLVRRTGLWVHDEHRWLGASPDGLVGSRGGVEIKCPVSLPTRVPPNHRCQIYVQMAVLGWAWCDYWAWTPTRHYYERLQSPRSFAGLIWALERFRRDFILTEKEPPRKRPRRRKKLASAEPEATLADGCTAVAPTL